MLACEAAAAVLWLLPAFAAGLVALLRYSFGSLFVIGEAVVSALLRTGGTGAADTLYRLQEQPFMGLAQSGAGAVLSVAAAALVFRRSGLACGCAALATVLGWWWSAPFVMPLLLAGCILATGVALTPRNP